MDKIIQLIIAKKAKGGNTYSNIKVQKILLERAQYLDFFKWGRTISGKMIENVKKDGTFGEIGSYS